MKMESEDSRRLLSNLKAFDTYDGIMVTPIMSVLAGEIVTINTVGDKTYSICNHEKSKYCVMYDWTDAMFDWSDSE